MSKKTTQTPGAPAAASPRRFITCPRCGAKSKKNYSFGLGIENRTCRNGHNFEIDRFGGMNHYIDAAGRTTGFLK